MTLASWTAQRRASVLARSGDDFLVVLAQILIGTTRWFLAMTAMAALESNKAASTLSLIQIKRGGGRGLSKVGQEALARG